jgi:hypothetical protein
MAFEVGWGPHICDWPQLHVTSNFVGDIAAEFVLEITDSEFQEINTSNIELMVFERQYNNKKRINQSNCSHYFYLMFATCFCPQIGLS